MLQTGFFESTIRVAKGQTFTRHAMWLVLWRSLVIHVVRCRRLYGWKFYRLFVALHVVGSHLCLSFRHPAGSGNGTSLCHLLPYTLYCNTV